MAKEPKPIYVHDCTTCEFLETFVLDGKSYDLYRCEAEDPAKRSSLGPTYIARYSSQGAEYWSMSWEGFRSLGMENPATPLLREVQRRSNEFEAVRQANEVWAEIDDRRTKMAKADEYLGDIQSDVEHALDCLKNGASLTDVTEGLTSTLSWTKMTRQFLKGEIA